VGVVDTPGRTQLQAWLPWVYAVSFTGLGALVPYLALTLKRQGIEGWTLAFALGALPLGRLIAVPLWSLAADMFQAATWILRLGAAVGCVGAGLLWGWTGGSVALLMTAMVLISVGRAPSGAVLDGIALSTLPSGDRNAYGRFRRWGSVGFLLSVFAVGWLAEHAGIRPFDAVFAAAIAFFAVTMAMPSLGRVERVRIGVAFRALARDPHVWWVLLVAAVHFAAHVAITAFLAVHLDGLGYSSTWTGAALALGVSVEVIVMSFAPQLLNRWHPSTLYLGATVVGLLRWFAMGATDSGTLLVLLQGLHGVSFGVFWIAGVALMDRRARPEVATSAQGLLAAAVGGLGSAMGTMGASLVVSAMSTHALFTAAQIVSAVAVAGAVAVRWTR
jgi:PPP family 3-phenylpropionic acid transporter